MRRSTSSSRRVSELAASGVMVPGAGAESRSWTSVRSSLVAVTSRNRWTVRAPFFPLPPATRMLMLSQIGLAALVWVRMSKDWIGSAILTSVDT